MYKSVIREGKFLVLVADGVFDAPLLELPSEELADKVAYELQSAWDEGVAWGSYRDDEVASNTGKEIQKFKALSETEKEAYQKN